QMLYYIASCNARPVHIANIREVFGIDEETVATSNRGLVHIDALVTAISGALDKLNAAADFITSNDLAASEGAGMDLDRLAALENIESAQCRLDAASQVSHADALSAVYSKLKKLYEGGFNGDTTHIENIIAEIVRGIVDVKLDLEYKLEHGVCSSFSSREFELRESVISATFTQMNLIENQLHAILRRKALAAALLKKPNDAQEELTLTLTLHRYLNKSEGDHEELRAAVQASDNGEADIDLLFELATKFFNDLELVPERSAIRKSQQLMAEIAGALTFAGMEKEGEIIEHCNQWLAAASKAGSVREDEAFRCFADVFAQIEMHLQRFVIDPLDDTSHMIAFADERAQELDHWIEEMSHGADVVTGEENAEQEYVQDGDIPVEFREVFIEESEEIVEELQRLQAAWAEEPELNENLRDMRRHFHTFKGNGRAVGANILGELGWASQDLLDRVLEGELPPNDDLQLLVADVVSALPSLVMSYKQADGFDVTAVRDLTNKCFRLASSSETDLAGDMPQFEKGPAQSTASAAAV
ncbi:MAG: Hpt domain-containing protein, partial [Gammaproteobacteria bacterium]